MFAMTIFFLVLFGLTIGSFLNVLIYRTVHDESFVVGRSRCPHCKKQINWYDNIPLVSFLLLHAKCRYCHKQISWMYPAIEFITASLFVWWYVIGFTFFRLTQQPLIILQRGFWLCVGISFIVIFFADFLYGIIPDGMVIFLTGLGLIYRAALYWFGVMQPIDFWLTLGVSVWAVLTFAFLHWVTKGRGMGMGDVKFVFPLGLILGWPGMVLGVFLSFIIGAVVSLSLIAFGKKQFKQTVPFGPFLVAGAATTLLFGERIIAWYVTLL